jgi:hypothetical protein
MDRRLDVVVVERQFRDAEDLLEPDADRSSLVGHDLAGIGRVGDETGNRLWKHGVVGSDPASAAALTPSISSGWNGREMSPRRLASSRSVNLAKV